MDAQLDRTAAEIERYVAERLWDPHGVLYAYIDALTGRPFRPEDVPVQAVPRRATIDPWAYWTYEDSIQNAGMYLDALVRKHELTGDADALAAAGRVWTMLRHTYYCSQVYGIGSFLRPYGGFEGMGRWVEPLGTDQASPMFAGAYGYMRHVDAETRAEMTEILLRTLGWYEAQGFRYFYYKFLVHEWNTTLQHAASYYLPAIAWAGSVTGDPKWHRHLRERFSKFERGPISVGDSFKCFNLFRSFYWGGDLPVLRDCLGNRFGEFITPEMIEHAYRLCLADLDANYPGAGGGRYVRRVMPESEMPGFRPGVVPSFNRDGDMGFAYHYTLHAGRTRPRLELYFLCGLAAIGHEGAYRKAVEIMATRSRVPDDFTDFLLEDHAVLPQEVALFARGVGAQLVEWYRNYWLLKGVESQRNR